MEGPERNHTVLPISAVLLILGLGSYYLLEQPYRSLRPPQSLETMAHPGALEDLDARLWEDPFGAVERAAEVSACREVEDAAVVAASLPQGGRPADEVQRLQGSVARFEESAKHRLWQLAREVRRRSDLAVEAAGDRPPRRIVLLPVLVPGEPYFEQAETRRRVRYAVLSGLGEAGYVPESSDHVGVVETCWSSAERLEIAGGQPVPVPYEWFEVDRLRPPEEQGSEEAVLVLWLDESELRSNLWARVDDLLRHLIGYRPPRLGDDSSSAPGDEVVKRFDFRLIGPSDSQTLAEMLRPEAAKGGSLATRAPTRSLRWVPALWFGYLAPSRPRSDCSIPSRISVARSRTPPARIRSRLVLRARSSGRRRPPWRGTSRRRFARPSGRSSKGTGGGSRNRGQRFRSPSGRTT